MRRFFLPTSLGVLLIAGTTANCSNDADNCVKVNEPCGDGGSAAQGPGGATTSQGGGGATSTGGGGTGGCGSDCAECTTDADCTDPAKAKCDGDTCVPCDASPQCAGIAGTEVCDVDAGACVQCQLGEEGACDADAGQTCNLLTKECVGVGPESVSNCRTCTNDAQCAPGHKCIAMEFPVGTHHGYYCLSEVPLAPDECPAPFTAPLTEMSLSGHAAATYCGINEDLATCEAVLALDNNWRCAGVDGKCCSGSQPLMAGMCDPRAPEIDVPGAICRDLGTPTPTALNRCTYACAGAIECPTPAAQSSCGDGPLNEGPPNWCGG